MGGGHGQVACEQGQAGPGRATYVVNPLQLLLKQTLPDRDQGSERIREVD